MDEADDILISEYIVVDLSTIKPLWNEMINSIFERATLTRPEDGFMQKGSLNGMHSEDLGHLLTEMQFLPRAYPNAKW